MSPSKGRYVVAGCPPARVEVTEKLILDGDVEGVFSAVAFVAISELSYQLFDLR